MDWLGASLPVPCPVVERGGVSTMSSSIRATQFHATRSETYCVFLRSNVAAIAVERMDPSNDIS
jgi:hypothetical protein